MTAFICVVAALFGLCFGSFNNVLIYRMPRDESVVKPASHCASCGKPLKPWHLIPVFSWLFLGGKCAFCKQRISPRYMVVELLTGALFAVMAWRYPDAAVFYCALMALLVPIAFIDLATQEIPVVLLVCGGVAGAALVAWRALIQGGGVQVLIDAAVAAAVGFGVLFVIDLLCRLILRKPGFGYGDMFLMGVCGLFMPAWHVGIAYYFSVIIGGVWAVLLLKKQKRGTYFAFGPSLCAGVVLQLIVQYSIW